MEELISERDKLIANIAKEDNGNKDIEKQIMHLQQEKYELQKTLSLETKEVEENERNLRALKKELKKLKHNYENLVWERVEIERDVTKLESNIELIKKKLVEASDAKRTTDKLQVKLHKVKEEINEKIKERITVEELKKKLELELHLLKDILIEQFGKAYEINSQLTSEKTYLERKLKVRTAIDELLFSLNNDMESLKERVEREEKSRKQLGFIFTIEIEELKRRIDVESNAREVIRKQLDNGLSIYQTTAVELSNLKLRIKDLIEKICPKREPFSLNHHKDLIEILSSVAELEERVSSINNITLSPSQIELDTNSIESLMKVSTLNTQETSGNELLIDRNLQLEKQLRLIELKINEEQLAYSKLEKKYLNEISELSKFHNVKAQVS